MKLSIAFLTFISTLIIYPTAFALRGEGPSIRVERQPRTESSDTLRWCGTVDDKTETHTTEHKHRLRFVTADGAEYKIVDSPELVKLHHETGKSYVIEAEVEKTTRFLFWGGNLRVKKFTVLEEGAAKPHLEVTESSPRHREMGIRAKL